MSKTADVPLYLQLIKMTFISEHTSGARMRRIAYGLSFWHRLCIRLLKTHESFGKTLISIAGSRIQTKNTRPKPLSHRE